MRHHRSRKALLHIPVFTFEEFNILKSMDVHIRAARGDLESAAQIFSTNMKVT
jgi:hypothetical protein